MGNRISRWFIPVWGVGVLLVTSSLMVGHWVTLPHPAAGENLPASVTTSLVANGQKDDLQQDSLVLAFHFLYGDCPCSRRVLRQVVQRTPIAGSRERVVLIGEDATMQAAASRVGFEVDVVTPPQLKSKYGVEAAPLLVVTNGDAEILYSGGYTSRKQGLDISDVSIITSIVAGDMVDGLPLYGCAVSKSLRAIVDPLNLK